MDPARDARGRGRGGRGNHVRDELRNSNSNLGILITAGARSRILANGPTDFRAVLPHLRLHLCSARLPSGSYDHVHGA